MDAGNVPYGGEPGDGRLDALNDADVADLWVMDPTTGSYRLRIPGVDGEPTAASPATGGGSAERLPAAREGSRTERRPAAHNRTSTPPRTSPEAEPARPRPPRTNRRAPKAPNKAKKRVKRTAITLAGVLVVVVGGAYGYYLYLNSRIKKTDRSAANEIPPSAANEFGRTPLNILLIGWDTHRQRQPGRRRAGTHGPREHHDPDAPVRRPLQRHHGQYPARQHGRTADLQVRRR
ncbi:hypothetical protein [Yinghuangia sp. YIM S10712]|uniref:hypothetical protein n=1 Tax=Yinghuangia sp. YIM S10712 TaxID=3436930 RepID=UPI003F531B3A